MEVLYYILTFSFVLVTAVTTDVQSSSFAEAEATSQGAAYSSAIAESSATSNCNTPKPKCGRNEKEVSCINSICEKRNCSDIGKPIKCVRIDPRKCIKGCICKDKYLRDDKTGRCIPENQCPIPIVRCGPNEVYSSCVNGGCGRWNCSQPGEICIKLKEGACREGCHCKDTYLRDDNGTCIPADECPLTCTGRNEVIGCRSACPETCDSIDRPCTRMETAFCTPVCRCKPGFYRNKNEECVPKAKCPKKCGLNEIYDICPPICPPPRCDVDEKVTLCLTNPEPGDKDCKPGCRCIDNYKKNSTGICIPKETCPPICGPDEEYNACVNGGCGRWECSQQAPLCVDLVEGGCVEGCRCKEPLLRADDGSCVPADQCPPPICGPDEEYNACANGGCGRWECSQQGPLCIDLIEGGCVEGCRCKEPLLRADDGTCVPADQCPLICTGQNEVAGCRSLCPETCESIGKNCTIIEAAVCTPECRCKPGFYRNKIGDCISEDECLKCTAPHEFFSCGSACDNVCSTLKTQNQTSCPIVNVVCNPMCYCEENFARDSYNKCIPIEDCPETECGVNEIYDECPSFCSSLSCDVDERLIRCAKYPLPSGNSSPDEPCKPGCRCIDNYKKNKSGVCIPKEQCPPICGPDEEYNSCANGGCGRWECSQQAPLCIDLIEGGCVEGCRCKEPLLRADDGSCVSVDQCPPPICGPDEEYNACANGGCGRWECSQQGLLCMDLLEGGCVEGCRCKEPLLRADDGTCVPADQCPLICTRQNEVAGCRSLCPETCESIGKNCTIIEAAVCTPECRCQPGFYRNKIGDCISEEECLKCTGPHEFFSCGSACDNVCSTLKTQNQTSCPIVNTFCNPMCYCEENFARDSNNKCIPIEDCPKTECGVNEIYDECPSFCSSLSCDVDERLIRCAKYPLPCGNSSPDEACKPGCRCIDNYKKNKSGVCIPKEQCPPICGPDEEYNSCANGGCGRWECSQQAPLCIDLIEGGCVEGCRCKEPLLRADDGTCVPADQCPLICTGQNEVAGCQTLCPETCESIGKNCTIIEPAVCVSACRCKPGYYRNKIGDCISEEQCLQCTGPHEYFSCGSACDNVCETLSTQNQTKCPIVNIVCNKKCYCEKDYARDSFNICIPIEECPNKENGIKKFTDGNLVFTENFLKVASKLKSEVSAIYSPFSLLFLLAQLALYATGISKQQLFNVLNLQSENLIRSTIPVYLDEFNSQQNVSLDLAERVYGTELYKFSEKFLKDTKDIFKAEAQNLDFSKPTEAAKTINDWVALKTHDLIQNLVSPSMFSEDTRLVLVNAIYFKGNWAYPFPKENTKQQDFYVNDNKSVKVNMMNQIRYFKYAELSSPNIQVLEMPYENRNLTFLACLPKSRNGIDELIDALGNLSSSLLKTATSSLYSTKVDVSLPTMDISTTTDLNYVLKQLNVTAIFNPQTAGLSDILEEPQNLFVSSAIQKATIIVTETGTKAAAANALIFTATAAVVEEIITFNANHPYAYFILYQAIVVGVTSVLQPVEITKFVADHTFAYFILYNGTPIFSGVYRGPQ